MKKSSRRGNDKTDSQEKRSKGHYDAFKKEIKILIIANCEDASQDSTSQKYYEITDEPTLIEIAKIDTILAVYDGDHDLCRKDDMTNPEVDYFDSFENSGDNYIIINGEVIQIGTLVELQTKSRRWTFTSQLAIKNKMKEILETLPTTLKGVLGYEFSSKIIEIDKGMIDLQKYLKETEQLELGIIETHRGGPPDNSSSDDRCYLYKGEISTIFDLGSKLEGSNLLSFGKVQDSDGLQSNTTNPKQLHSLGNRSDKSSSSRSVSPETPLIQWDTKRFFSNYFPNAFTLVVKKDEILQAIQAIQAIQALEALEAGTDEKELKHTTLGKLFAEFVDEEGELVDENGMKKPTILHIFFKNFGLNSFDEFKKLLGKLEPNFGFIDNGKNVFLLHMFMKKTARSYEPMFSIQRGPVTADQVTNKLYGVKNRLKNISKLLSLTKETVPPSVPELLLLFDETDKTSKIIAGCHTVYSKTSGDGVSFELIEQLSREYPLTPCELSSDLCCDYRNAFRHGISVRQAPSAGAGTGLGALFNKRKIEIIKMKNAQKTKLSDCIEIIADAFFYETRKTDLDDVQLPDVKISSKSNKTIPIDDNITKKILESALICFKNKITESQLENQEKIKNFLQSPTQEGIDCDLLKELCKNPQILFLGERVQNIIDEFAIKLLNAIENINEKYKDNIEKQSAVDKGRKKCITYFTDLINSKTDDADAVEKDQEKLNEFLEEIFLIISALEQLLDEIDCDEGKAELSKLQIIDEEDWEEKDTTIIKKQILLYYLTIVTKKTGSLIIDRYIESLKKTLIKYLLEGDIEQQYLYFRDVFANKFAKTKKIHPKYNDREQAKKLLNLLKFIERSTMIMGSEEEEEGIFRIFRNKVFKEIEKVTKSPPQTYESESSLPIFSEPQSPLKTRDVSTFKFSTPVLNNQDPESVLLANKVDDANFTDSFHDTETVFESFGDSDEEGEHCLIDEDKPMPPLDEDLYNESRVVIGSVDEYNNVETNTQYQSGTNVFKLNPDHETYTKGKIINNKFIPDSNGGKISKRITRQNRKKNKKTRKQNQMKNKTRKQKGIKKRRQTRNGRF